MTVEGRSARLERGPRIVQHGRGEDAAVAWLMARIMIPAGGAPDGDVVDDRIECGLVERAGRMVGDEHETTTVGLRCADEDPDCGAMGRPVRDHAARKSDDGLEQAGREERPTEPVRIAVLGQAAGKDVGGAEDHGGAVVGEEITPRLDRPQDAEGITALAGREGDDADEDVRIAEASSSPTAMSDRDSGTPDASKRRRVIRAARGSVSAVR